MLRVRSRRAGCHSACFYRGSSHPGEIDSLLGDAFARYRDARDGEVADYIPILGAADPDLFGISLVTADGRGHALGASAHAFSIQSISKAFVYALVCDALGHEVVHERVGVNNTGLPFNSVVALELNAGSPMNPMVNAGAIATTGLVDADAAAAWEKIQSGLSAFGGRDLLLDEEVFGSEMVTNQRNRAIAHLLSSYGRLDQDALGVVSTYTKQCALSVTTADLAVMGATLGDGGVNPVTGDRVGSAQAARDTLSVLASCGMYERSGSGSLQSDCLRSQEYRAGSWRCRRVRGPSPCILLRLMRRGTVSAGSGSVLSSRERLACTSLLQPLALQQRAQRHRPQQVGRNCRSWLLTVIQSYRAANAVPGGQWSACFSPKF